MHSIILTTSKEMPVKYLEAQCDVRYWEDATVDGVEDEDGTLIPCRKGDTWNPVIDLESGAIEGWPKGVVAKVHYKVCDDGRYTLLNQDKSEVAMVDGYVIGMMCPEGGGYGDYVIMKIDENGQIKNWSVNLRPFEEDS